MKSKTSINLKKFIIVFSFFFIFFLSAFYYKDQLRNSAFQIFSPFQRFFWQKFQTLYSFVNNISNIKKLFAENQNLKKENIELKTQIENLKEGQKECEFIKRDLKIEPLHFDYTIARVIAKTTDPDVLLIDKGEKENVFEEEVVLGEGKILIGKIQKVYQNFSKLKLITSKDFKVLVRRENSENDLLLEGEGNLDLILNLVPKEITLNVGEKIFTSPSQTDFPPLLFIGEIKEVIKKETLPYQQAKIKPYFSNVEFVYLIKNFKSWTER
jgi:rod shape-determining protein MreC